MQDLLKRHGLRLFCCTVLCAFLFSGSAAAASESALVNLDFEQGESGEVPPGWLFPSGPEANGYTARTVEEQPESGKRCALLTLEDKSQGQNAFGNLLRTFDATPYRGKRVRLRAAVRAEVTTGHQAQLWLRVDRPNFQMGFFDNMEDRPKSGTLPGDYWVAWTGMRVLKHDGSRHHGVGIQPTILVARTRRGVAEGRDEVLERALEVVSTAAEEQKPDIEAADSPQGVDQTVDLTMTRRRMPASQEVVAWIHEHAIPLATPEAEKGFDDLGPVRELIGDARVVGLGEATHGTREFFQLKHRMLEFLVEEMGFTVFAIEANWPEALAINDYVVAGKGNAKGALAGIYFWTWNTEEVLELIEWMRRYNADAKHETKIKFYGFDMQFTAVAAREAVAYLSRVNAAYAQEIDALLDPLETPEARATYKALSTDERRALVEGIDEVLRRLDARRPSFVERSSERAWILGRQQVVILQQAVKMFSGSAGPSFRDQAMAANIRWILDTEPPGTRVVAWAHNYHVSSAKGSHQPMGRHLHESLGDDYVVLGFAFNQGSFQAIDRTRGAQSAELREHTVGPAPAANVGAALARAGMPIFVLDLRQRPASGKVASWFEAPHPMRDIGAMFAGEQGISPPVVLPRHFDAVIFVDQTTRARPVKGE